MGRRWYPRVVAGMAPVAVVVVLVAVMAQLPTLRNPSFYLSDDSAAQFLPTWYHLGTLLREGRFPQLDPGMWAGGNVAGEALFGIWNPVQLATMVLVSVLPGVQLASVVVKTEYLVILAVGVYGVAREYRVRRWLAVVPAVTVPFAGATLYFDASSWASGLVAFAFVPHFWWTLRRAGRGRLNPVVAFVAGFLAVTSGNPYGTVGACLVVVGLLVECGVARRWLPLRRVLVGGVATGLVAPLVYLPLVLTQPVTYRNGAGLSNDGLMVPALSDLLNASTPSFDAYVHAFEAPYLTVPATYVAWYLVPLLPWLRYDRLRRLLPSLVGLLTITALALLLCTGPSDAWMFRWPLRVVPYLALPAAVLTAVALNQGLARTAVRRRIMASAVLVAVGAYWAVAARPNLWHVHAASLVLEAVLIAALVIAFLRSRHGSRTPAAVLVGGCVLVLALQVWAYPSNRNFTGYAVPASYGDVRAELAGRYPGTVLVVADNGVVQHSTQSADRSNALLFGNQFHAAGINTVTTYYGMGFQAFSSALCLGYNGSTCGAALAAAWRPATPGGPLLADLLKLDTIVVQNDLPGTGGVRTPPGWATTYRDHTVTVLQRELPLPYPDGRLAAVPPGTDVVEDSGTDTEERIDLRGGPGGSLILARLAWPGYRATLDGHALPVRQGPAGLLTVDVPPGATGSLLLTWTPPGQALGGSLALTGALLALVEGAVFTIRRRRRLPSVSVELPPQVVVPDQRLDHEQALV